MQPVDEHEDNEALATDDTEEEEDVEETEEEDDQDVYEDDEDDDGLTLEAMVGEYANYISVGSTQTEFYIDFFQVVPGADAEQVMPVRRLLVSPMLIRGLMRALDSEVARYEATYRITLPIVQS